MIWTILLWYVVISYIAGVILFTVELVRTLRDKQKAIEAQKHTLMDLSRYINVAPLIQFGILVLLASPLTAWHGVLHYAALLWAKWNNKPVKFWV